MKRRFFSNKTGEKIDLSKPYFAIEALEDRLIVKLSINACEYCIDDGTWITLPPNTSTVYINAGQTLSFRGNLTPTPSNGIGTFTISKKCNIKGNVMSLLYGDYFEEHNDLTSKNRTFYRLFQNCTNIVDVSELILPATILSSDCYSYMFYGCTNLKNAPALPATTLVERCYNHMFYGCTSLVIAPELPATTLAASCYEYMFTWCTKLNYIKALFTTTPDRLYTYDWVRGVSSSGTFVKNKNATWDVTGDDSIPNGWTVQTA